MATPLTIFLFSAFFVACGTGISTVAKLMFSTKSVNIDGKTVVFEKPWYQNWLMCFGMCCTFILVWIQKCRGCYKNVKPKKRNWNWLKNLLPSSLDTISSFLIGVALVIMPVSLWQMFRGSLIVFTALFTVCYRKRKLFRHEWIGVSLAVTALIILGVVALCEKDANENAVHRQWWQIVLGIGLVLVGQAMSAGQTIVLEVFLHDNEMDELTLVSWGGFWGMIICMLFMIIAYFIPTKEGDGLHENSIDTVVMVVHSLPIFIYSLIYTILILCFNVAGMFIINMTNALARNVTEQMRTLFIWLISLFIYYIVNKDYGEKWGPLSFLQLIGFLIMSVGVLIYNGIIKLRILMGDAYEAVSTMPSDFLDDDSGEGRGGGDDSEERRGLLQHSLKENGGGLTAEEGRTNSDGEDGDGYVYENGFGNEETVIVEKGNGDGDGDMRV